MCGRVVSWDLEKSGKLEIIEIQVKMYWPGQVNEKISITLYSEDYGNIILYDHGFHSGLQGHGDTRLR